ISQSFVFAQSGNSSSKLITKSSERTTTTGSNKAPVTGEMIEADLAEALTVIEENYVNGKNLDYNDLFKSSIDGMLHVLDPHSNYLDAKEFEQFRTEQRSEYFGIGATIGDLRENDTTWTYIRATFDNAPAHRAGLRYGDKIVEVNGVSMKNKTFVEVRNNLRGPRGTTAKITVQKNGTNEMRTVEIVRDAVPQPSIPEYYMLRPGVGYIAMTGGFHHTTVAEFREAMRGLKAQGMQQLVLDLRNNPGGLVNQAHQVANTFLQRGQVVFTQKGRIPGSSGTYQADNLNPDKTPIVVLVNRGSASASEILAGALQDHDRALIVGESTFGKGLVQNPFGLPYNSALVLTIAKYQTPSGRDIQRDYSTGSFYDYYTQGGTLRDEKVAPKQTGRQSRTDAGRIVYSGDGIMPDEIVKPALLTPIQQRLNNPVFGFALELAAGKVPGFESYKIDGAIQFDRDLKSTDFPVTTELFAAFKRYMASKPDFKQFTPAQLDREREFISRQIRFELATAAFGSNTAFQTYNEADPQIKRGIDLLPRAKELAQLSKGGQNQNP
ncbi:MAG TPA: S41 family peptidase, partial [Pyrinomonadaceae bacterium]|nr:S41 family peptidase [Pyrinomonadaceae bacterium]